MNFDTNNQKEIDDGLAEYQGMIATSYQNILSTFGMPLEGTLSQSHVEWRIEWEDGVITTIYDYMSDRAPHDNQVWYIDSTAPSGYVRAIQVLER